MKEFDAVVVDNQDPQGRNRVKLKVIGHTPSDLPESELPWSLVQPKIGSNSGKGQKETLTIGQFCKVQALDKAETEFKVIAGSNAFRDPNNKKGKPYSVIENSELFSVPIPDIASLDPEKLARTIFVPLMEKITKRISEPVKPFVGVCGMVDPSSNKQKGGCGGGKPGCGGPGVPRPGSDGLCSLPAYQSKIRCTKRGGVAKIDCKKFNSICGCKPVSYNMKFDWEKSVQTLSGKEIWVPCLESDIDIQPVYNKPGDPSSGCKEANGNSCDGITAGCNKKRTTCQGLSICFAENIPCSKKETLADGTVITGLQTNKMWLTATSKLPLNKDIPGNVAQPPITVPCEFYCGNNSCSAAKNCPGGANAPFAADNPFALGLDNLHEYTGVALPPPESGNIKTVTIEIDKQILNQTNALPVAINKEFLALVSVRNAYQQTLAPLKDLLKNKLPSIIYGKISVDLGSKLSDQADKYIQEMFGNLVNQANRVLSEVQAASISSINTAIDGALKIVDNSAGAQGALDDVLGGVEKIPIEVMDQVVGGFGLGAVPGAFFHEVIRTDFLGEIEKKFVTQYENGITQVVDTSRGNKTWGVATNDGARIEIANNGTTLVKGANDVQIATESGTVSVTGANSITIVDGKATIHCDSFSLKAKTVTVASPVIALNGDVEINGKLGVKETIEAEGKIFSQVDVIAQKKPDPITGKGPHVSLYGHTHISKGKSKETLPPTIKP